MEEQTEAFIFAAPEVEQLLADNGTSIDELLRRQGYEVDRGTTGNPATDADKGTREIATTILASAALVAAMTPILMKIIQSLTYKGVVVHETVLIPIEDSSGDIISDSDGNAKLQWVRRSKLLESSRDPATQEVKIKALGFEVEIKSLG